MFFTLSPIQLSGEGVPPYQVWTGGGYPFPSGGGHPFPGLDGGRGYPPGKGVPPPHQTSTACTCYAAGGVPLAFTQEDFLVLEDKFELNSQLFALKSFSQTHKAGNVGIIANIVVSYICSFVFICSLRCS